jgi:hypothetical protein
VRSTASYKAWAAVRLFRRWAWTASASNWAVVGSSASSFGATGAGRFSLVGFSGHIAQFYESGNTFAIVSSSRVNSRRPGGGTGHFYLAQTRHYNFALTDNVEARSRCRSAGQIEMSYLRLGLPLGLATALLRWS